MPPRLTVTADGDASAEGRIRLTIETEPGALVSIESADGEISESFRAEGRESVFEEEVAPGSYELVVTVTDRLDNESIAEVTVEVEDGSDEPTAGETAGSLAVLALVMGGVGYWQRDRIRGWADSGRQALGRSPR